MFIKLKTKNCFLVSLIFFIGLTHVEGSRALRDDVIKEGESIKQSPLADTNYVVFRKSLGWVEAREVCEMEIGRLAVFETKESGVKAIEGIKLISTPFSEEYDRSEFKYEFGMDRRYWIGLTDLGLEGDWTWMNHGGKLSYKTLWYPNQPDHIRKHDSEHCVSLWNPIYYRGESHTWNDEPCLHKLYFICEKLEKSSDGGFINPKNVQTRSSVQNANLAENTEVPVHNTKVSDVPSLM